MSTSSITRRINQDPRAFCKLLLNFAFLPSYFTFSYAIIKQQAEPARSGPRVGKVRKYQRGGAGRS